MLMRTLSAPPLSPESTSAEIGVVDTRGGIITVDEPLAEYFKKLHVGTGGTVLVRGKDNNIIPYRNIASGDWLFVLGYEVVSAATVSGVALTTTASDIDWYGGF